MFIKMLIIINLLFLSHCYSFEYIVDFNRLTIEDTVVSNIPYWDLTTINRVEKFVPVIDLISRTTNVPLSLVVAIAWTESHFNPKSISSAGALGIMQVKPTTQKYIMKKFFYNNEKYRRLYTEIITQESIKFKNIDNLIAGTLYIKYLLKKYKGNIQKSIISYNMGPTGTSRMINKNYNLDTHNYFKKVSNKIKIINLKK
jgi:soluble lytic murein transglycosylase